MRTIRFRCPRCRMHHAAASARAGQAFACPSCFGAMTIPEASPDGPAEVPTARPIEFIPPDGASTDDGSAAEEIIPTPPRSRRRPAAGPTPRIEPSNPVPQEPDCIESEAPESGPIERGTGPARRVAMALTAIVVLVAAIGVVALTHRAGVAKAPEVGTLSVSLPRSPATDPARPIVPSSTQPPGPPPTPDLARSIPNPPAPGVPSLPVSGPSSVVKVEAAPPSSPDPVPTPGSEPVPAKPLVVRRRQMLDQEALRQHLATLPELRVSHESQAVLRAGHSLRPLVHRPPHSKHHITGQAGFLGPAFSGHVTAGAHSQDSPMHVAQPHADLVATLSLLKGVQPALIHLPWRLGEDCHLDRESAEELEIQSRALRDELQRATPPGDPRPDPEALEAALLGPGVDRRRLRKREAAAFGGVPADQVHRDRPAAIPALMQLLMAERTPTRLVLVDLLARIEGPSASKALARLAIFDLAPEVRERALVALRERPAAESRPSFLEGLHYPWSPFADHAAEALVALEDRAATPELIPLLVEPDPEAPRTEIRDGHPVTFTRKLVQVNHLRNCLLCHAPSSNTSLDLVKGRVPVEGTPLPPPQAYYADRGPGEFVRADVTYLRQDFSVTQPVDEAGPWPAYQRYDYVVAEQPAARTHPAKATPGMDSPQRRAVLFALRELTGKDLGETAADWQAEGQPHP